MRRGHTEKPRSLLCCQRWLAHVPIIVATGADRSDQPDNSDRTTTHSTAVIQHKRGPITPANAPKSQHSEGSHATRTPRTARRSALAGSELNGGPVGVFRGKGGGGLPAVGPTRLDLRRPSGDPGCMPGGLVVDPALMPAARSEGEASHRPDAPRRVARSPGPRSPIAWPLGETQRQVVLTAKPPSRHGSPPLPIISPVKWSLR